MQESTFALVASEGTRIHVYRWLPDPECNVKGVVQIAHGMGETAARYAEFAGILTQNGYAVYANDHRGHGKTVENAKLLGNAGIDAFRWMASDMINLGEVAAKENPGVPLFLMGHSMGSFLVQHLMYAGHEQYHAFILSGTNGRRGLLRFGEKLAFCNAAFRGLLIPACCSTRLYLVDSTALSALRRHRLIGCPGTHKRFSDSLMIPCAEQSVQQAFSATSSNCCLKSIFHTIWSAYPNTNPYTCSQVRRTLSDFMAKAFLIWSPSIRSFNWRILSIACIRMDAMKCCMRSTEQKWLSTL